VDGVEQEKIDVTRATPVSEVGTSKGPARKGAPLWLQLLLSAVVIVAAVGIAALFNPTANALVAKAGVALPQLNAAAPVADAVAAAPAGQQTRQGQGSGQGGGTRQGAGGGGSRTAVVVAAAVGTGTINNKLTSIGEGSAIRSVTVNTSQSGTLMTVEVKAGDKVVAGDKLATLDFGTQQNAYDKANLATQDADAALMRIKQLAKSGSSSVSDTQIAAAQLAVAQAKLALNDAKLALDQRTIITPVSGTVGLIQVTPGNLINAQTVVTTVEDSSEILVNFWVPERYSSQIAVGAPVNAESSAMPGQNFSGTITAIDNRIDATSRTLQVQATLPNPDGKIKSGMSFSVDMAFPGQTFASVDPLSVQWSNNGAYVWKIVGGKVQKGMVEIVQRNSDGVLVKGDVKQGDQVVTQGVLQLSDGAAVRLLDQPQTAEAGAQQGQGGETSAQAAQGLGQGQGKKRSGQSASSSTPGG
jgi:RND family efflux transporter MFP subunit